MIERLCVIGVGLMGASIAKAARAMGLCRQIIGLDEDRENLLKAKALGVIDGAAETIQEAVKGADFVVIATPVGSIRPILAALRPVWSQDAIYTDVGSTKAYVVEAAKAIFGRIPPNLVPGHPIAGAEKSGVEAACADLYQGRRVILTPLPNTSKRALQKVGSFWRSLGAQVSEMEVDHHDHVLAATSHLPHVIAYALVHMLGRKDEKQEIFKYAAGGFKDFTRIASSDPTMWRDICRANRAEISALLEQFKKELDTVIALLQEEAFEELYDFFCGAKSARQRFLDQFER